jgi:hypothetical protein
MKDKNLQVTQYSQKNGLVVHRRTQNATGSWMIGKAE